MKWMDLFAGHILKRGSGYYEVGRVRNLVVEGDRIEALVEGSEPYDVQISMENGSVKEMTCNCPYANDGNNCKHMAAVLFAWQEGLSQKSPDFEDREEHESVRDLVGRTDDKSLKEFLVRQLEQDQELLYRFQQFNDCDLSLEDLLLLRGRIDGIFSAHEDRSGFIHFARVGSFETDLIALIDGELANLVSFEHQEEAFDLSAYLFLRLGQQDLDDSMGSTMTIADACSSLWEKILLTCDLAVKEKMFRWMLMHLRGLVVDYMEEYLEDFLRAHFREPVFVNRLIEHIKERVSAHQRDPHDWSNRYSAEKWAIWQLEVLLENGASDDQVISYCEEHLVLDEVRKRYAAWRQERGEIDQAIVLLREGLDETDGWSGLQRDYSVQLKNLYFDCQDHEAYEQELWSLVLKYDKGKLEWFRALKNLYPEVEWIEKRERVFEIVGWGDRLAELYKEEGLFDRLLTLVINDQGLYLMNQYEAHLKDRYPEELLSKFVSEVEEMASVSSNRKKYREIVAILRRMHGYPSGKQQVETIVGRWKKAYKRRSAMMEELLRL